MTYICVADVQHHEAELTVLILVQLMNQLSVVSLQDEHTTQAQGLYANTYNMHPICAENNIVIIAFTLHSNRAVSLQVAKNQLHTHMYMYYSVVL